MIAGRCFTAPGQESRACSSGSSPSACSRGSRDDLDLRQVRLVTITLARGVQAWFTSSMKTITRREDKYDKAKRILSTPRSVTTIESCGTDYWLGYVEGDHGTYKVCAVSADYAEALMGDRNKRLYCPCRAGRVRTLCSHAIIGEEMRLRGEDA